MTEPEKRPRNPHVRMEAALYAKAKKLAALRGVNLSDMIAEVVRPWVDREWSKEVKKLKEEEGT